MIRDMEIFLTIIKILFEKNAITEMEVTPEEIEKYRLKLLKVDFIQSFSDETKTAKVYIKTVTA